MSGLSRFSLKNGVAVVILSLLVLAAGFYSSTQIKQQTFPDVSFPAIFVQIAYPGASAEEVESTVTSTIEESLMNLKGYDSLTSTSSENTASISLQYAFGKNMDNAVKDVEGALAKVILPDKATATVKRMSAGAQPIYTAAVFSTKDDPRALQQSLEEQIVPKLRKIAGVSAVNLKGTGTGELNIVVDKDKAAKYGISLPSIRSAIQASDYAVSVGSVNQESTTIPIRLVGKLNAIQQLENVQLAGGQGQGASASLGQQGGQQPAQQAPQSVQQQAQTASSRVKLSDIATIENVSKYDQITRFNGKDSFLIEVLKNQDANTADVSNKVKDALGTFKDQASLDIHVVQDQGKQIEESVSSLIREGLYGALFTVIVIFLFLRNVRATLIAIVSLPISIFTTIVVLDQMGYTLNIMTLGGIAVSIGRIVDDSIVVIENIYRWRQEKGADLRGKELAYNATKEVIGAVASSTFATLVVFLPLAFVTGIIGEFFRPFSVAVVSSIVVSLLVSMMLIPVLGAKFFTKVKPHKQGGKMIAWFEALLRGALKRKGWVLVLAFVLLAGSLGTIPLLGVSFLPSGSSPSMQVDLTLPANKGLEQTKAVSQKIESFIKQLNGLKDYQATIGGVTSGRFMTTNGAGNKASFSLQFETGTVIQNSIDTVNRSLKPIVDESVPGAILNVKESASAGPPSGNNVDISLYSSDLNALAKAAGQVQALLEQNGQLKDITNNLKDVTPKWELSINQKGKDLNVSYLQAMQAVNERLKPVNVGTYTLDNKKTAVTMTYKQAISTKEQLQDIAVQTSGGPVKLKEIADLTEANAPITVNHEDGRTSAKISASVKGTNTAQVSKQVKADVLALSLPSGVDVKIGGGLAMIQSGFKSIGLAMGAAVGLVFLIMSMAFGGLRTPLIILSSLLFVPVGALTGLLVTGQTLSMSAMIGMLMLVGIVVTNAVVLLDRVENNLKNGIPLTEAIVEASKVRLRPILMTACATILALVPLALSESSSSLISKGLAVTVIGGLTTSTLLTLIVVPVIYQMTGKNRKFEQEAF